MERPQGPSHGPGCAFSGLASHVSVRSCKHILQPQATFPAEVTEMSSPPKPCPHCPFVNEIYDCRFKPLHFRMVCYTEAPMVFP